MYGYDRFDRAVVMFSLFFGGSCGLFAILHVCGVTTLLINAIRRKVKKEVAQAVIELLDDIIDK